MLWMALALAYGCRSKYPDCSSTDIELADACLLGSTIQEAIDKLHLDTTQYIPYFMGGGRELHGIYVRMGDTCKISILIYPPVILTDDQMKDNIKNLSKYVLRERITGICWRKEKVRKVRVVGDMRYRSCWDY